MSKFKPFASSRVTIKNHRTGKSWQSPKPMKVFVDSGSTITILPPAALPLIQQKTGQYDIIHARINTANGVKDAVALEDVSFCLKDSCFRGNVLITDGIAGDVLLGTDFLAKAGCSMDFKRKKMKCKGGNIPFKLES